MKMYSACCNAELSKGSLDFEDDKLKLYFCTRCSNICKAVGKKQYVKNNIILKEFKGKDKK